MALPVQTILNGVSSTTIFSLAILMAITVLLKYRETKKPLLPHVALLGFSLGSFYSGGTVSFFAILFTGESIPVLVAGLLSYTLVPLAITDSMYIGFTVFRPKYVKQVVLLFACTTVLYWIALFGFPEVMISGNVPAPGETTDTGLRSVVLYLTIFYIVSLIVIVCGGFYKLAQKIEGEEKRKSLFVSEGFLLFSIASVVEILLFGPFIIIPRVVTAISYWLLYRGFT